jgi:hypothetical protein
MLKYADEEFKKCVSVNNQFQQCYINYFLVLARAAYRLHLAGRDAQPRLAQALETLAAAKKLGGSFLDVEQHAALAHYVAASARVRKQQDPADALRELDAALLRCFGLAAQDATCKTLAAQREWISADWSALQKQSPGPALQRALGKAIEATRSPETYPDAWQVLAETHLRLARSAESAKRLEHAAAGLSATEKIFAITPNHVAGKTTREALQALAREVGAAKDPP